MKYSRVIMMLIFASSRAYAFSPLDFKSNKPLNDTIQKILVIEEPERLTEEQYATTNRLPLESVKSNYAATGDFFCNGANGQTGQANLIVRKDVVVTAAHMVYKDLDCKKSVDLNQCRFRVTSQGKIQDYQIAEIINAGQKCGNDQKLSRSVKCPLSNPLASNQWGGISEGKDWIVLCLNHPVEGVEPYRLDPDLKPMELNDQEVVAVGKSMDFLKQGKIDWRNLSSHPKHIGTCRIREIYDWGAFGADDCDGSHGSSGGAILRRGSDAGHDTESRSLIGVRSQIGETLKESERAARTRLMKRVKHNTLKLNSVFIPVQGELLETLRALLKN